MGQIAPTRRSIARLAFRLARTRLFSRTLGIVFAKMSFLIPAQRLVETKTLLAFYHPQPSYPVHIVIVPKRAIASLAQLSPADADFTTDLFATVQELVARLGLAEPGYRLVANGGTYQDLPQLHFHLISGGLSED